MLFSLRIVSSPSTTSRAKRLTLLPAQDRFSFAGNRRAYVGALRDSPRFFHWRNRGIHRPASIGSYDIPAERAQRSAQISNCMLKEHPLSTANRKKGPSVDAFEISSAQNKTSDSPCDWVRRVGCLRWLYDQSDVKEAKSRAVWGSAHAYEAALGFLGFRTAAMINAHFPAGRQSEPLR